MQERNKDIPQANTGVIFLFYKEGMILVEDRPESDLGYSNITIVPGGKIRFREGEKPEEALLREVKEELGESVIILKKYDLGEFCDFTGRGNLQRQKAFFVTEYEGDIKNCEPEKGIHRWIPINDYNKELPLSSSKLVVERALRVLFRQNG